MTATLSVRPAPTSGQPKAFCRTSFYVFAQQSFAVLHPGVPLVLAPYIEALCYAIQQVAVGENRRLNINVPPRHLKSFLVSVALPAWMMGRDPSTKILFAAYGQELADEHTRNFLTLVRSPFFRTLFPAFTIKRAAADGVSTSLGGIRRATGSGGSLTGFGADLIIIDDLSKVGDANSPAALASALALYRETILPRFNDKATGRLIAIQQRIHENDLSGMLLGDTGFQHVVLPAIAVDRQCLQLYHDRTYIRRPGDLLNPARENAETLENLRREMGEAAFSGQYQQNPTPPGGNRIRWEWFEQFDDELQREDYEYVVQSWDTAVTGLPTSDFSVCITFGRYCGQWRVLDLFRARLDFPELKGNALALAHRWKPEAIVIERAGTGHPLWSELRLEPSLSRCDVSAPNPSGSKVVRVEVQTDALSQGFIQLPANAPWLSQLRYELLAFPNAQHDDQVDALVQFVAWARGRRGESSLETTKYGRPQDVERRP